MRLLSSLGGEAIDWKAIEEEFMPHALYQGCGFVKFKSQFQQQQWTRENRQRYCKVCVAQKVEAGAPLQGIMCMLWKREEAFSRISRRAPPLVKSGNS